MNRYKVYFNNPKNDLPEIRAMIAKHLKIPEEPRWYIQLYTDDREMENYYDPYGETTFTSLQEEYETRTESLDINRQLIEKQKERVNQEEHFKKLEEIQNSIEISNAQRTELQREEWKGFTARSQLLFKYIQVFEFEEKILLKKLAEYRRKEYAW